MSPRQGAEASPTVGLRGGGSARARSAARYPVRLRPASSLRSCLARGKRLSGARLDAGFGIAAILTPMHVSLCAARVNPGFGASRTVWNIARGGPRVAISRRLGYASRWSAPALLRMNAANREQNMIEQALPWLYRAHGLERRGTREWAEHGWREEQWILTACPPPRLPNRCRRMSGLLHASERAAKGAAP